MKLRLLIALFVAFVSLSAQVLAQGGGNPPPSFSALQNPPITAEQKADVFAEIKKRFERNMFVAGFEVSKWETFLEKQKENIDKAEKAQDFTTAVNRAFREFGFSHIRLLSPRAAAQRNLGARAIGVGVQASLEEGKGLRVNGVIPKSPAEEVGLKVGDLIIEIDGKLPDSASTLAGDDGTKVQIKVRSADGLEKTLDIQRKTYSTARPETLVWEDEETAILKIHTFSAGYDANNVDKLMEEAAKAKYLILDLRSNGGGSTVSLRHLLSLLLPPDVVIGTFVSKTMANDFKEKTGGDPANILEIAKWTDRNYKTRAGKVPYFKGKVAVLINRGTGSASEITAAALKELAGSPIVGSKSAGAVLASIFAPLPHGYQIQYPITDYVTAKGVRLEGNPLQPDFEAGGVSRDGIDAGKDKAVEVLKGKKPPLLLELLGFAA